MACGKWRAQEGLRQVREGRSLRVRSGLRVAICRRPFAGGLMPQAVVSLGRKWRRSAHEKLNIKMAAGQSKQSCSTVLSRREFVHRTAAAGALLALAPSVGVHLLSFPQDEFITWSATHVAKMIREKQITAVDAVNMCYARIDAGESEDQCGRRDVPRACACRGTKKPMRCSRRASRRDRCTACRSRQGLVRYGRCRQHRRHARSQGLRAR